MFKILPTLAVLLPASFLLTGSSHSAAAADDHSIEVIDSAPAAEAVSEEIAKQISSQGVRIKRGSSRTVCEVWFRKDLPIDPGFTPTLQRLYPFIPGELVGLIHFPRRGSDFRDQSMSSGWYTLRFALQPVDGNHIGTSPTQDFLLLVEAEQDEMLDQWEKENLHEASAEAAGSSHPAMLCLQPPTQGSESSIRHDDSSDWWIAHTMIQSVADGEPKDVPVDLVVVGHAAE